MTIFYSDAPGGAGKTAAIQRAAISLISQGENVLIIQLTKDLIAETEKGFVGTNIHCQVIHSGTNTDVTRKIVEWLNNPYPEAHILMITWEAFERLPYFNRKNDWHLFIDEVPQVHRYKSFNASISHSLITPAIDTVTAGSTYSRVIVMKKDQIKKLSDEGARDDAAKEYAAIARKLLSRDWDLFVNEAQYRDLLKGVGKTLSIFSIMKPSAMSGFKTVTIAAARFKETILFNLWSSNGVVFKESSLLKNGLRYLSHDGGEFLTIKYAYDCNWSKYLRAKDQGRVFQSFVDAINQEMKDKVFLWMANKDIVDSLFDAKAKRLPNVPHGLNQYQNDYDNLVFLSALNPAPDHFKFLEWMGIDSEIVKTETYRHVVYQSALRCSLRDPSNKNQKMIIVPDKTTADWLSSIFPGSMIQVLDNSLDVSFMNKKKGRKRIHDSDNDRKVASQASQLLRSKLLIDQIFKAPRSGWNDVVIDNDFPKSLDENTFTNEDKFMMDDVKGRRFHGSIWDHKEQKHTVKQIEGYTHNQFIDLLRFLSKRTVPDKESNRLISPSYFISKPGIDTQRGSDNIMFCNGLWLDFEKGNMMPKQFAAIFPRIRIAAYSTWQNTRENPRWRAYIPTDRCMTADEYKLLTREIVDRVKDAGFRLNKIDARSLKAKANGFDLGKLGPSSLFYLPCKRLDAQAAFFKDFKEGRSLLPVDEWVAYQRSDIGSAKEVSEISPEFLSEIDIQAELDRWRDEGTRPGQGDQGLFDLAVSLRKRGISGGELKNILKREARMAATPKDRLRQVERIMKQDYF